MQANPASVETNVGVPQKPKKRFTLGCSSTTPRQNHRDAFTFLFTAVHSRSAIEPVWVSNSRDMDKEDMVYVYNGKLLSHKMTEVM